MFKQTIEVFSHVYLIPIVRELKTNENGERNDRACKMGVFSRCVLSFDVVEEKRISPP